MPHDRQGVLVEFRLERSSSTIFGLLPRNGTRLWRRRSAILMAKRVLVVIALALAVGTCKATARGAGRSPGSATCAFSAFVSCRAPTPDPGSPPAGVTYVMATVALTNGTTHDMTPAIERFFLTARRNQRYRGDG